MKHLIIESGAHEQIIEPICEILEHNKENDIRVLGLKSRGNWFSEKIKNNYTLLLSSHLFFWIKAMIEANKVDYVLIFTPPEYSNSYRHTYFTSMFYFFILFFRKKTVIHIRNTTRWKSNKANNYSLYINDKIREKSLKIAKYLAFEYESIQLSLPIAKIYCSLPTSYWHNNEFSMKKNEKLKIVFVGGIDERKRDFDLISELITELTEIDKNKLSLIFASPIKNETQQNLITLLNKNVEVIINEDRKRYDEYISHADLLFAPLRLENGYGKIKGTGVFGDALSVNRKVIIPNDSYFRDEYNGLCIIYNNKNEVKSTLEKYIKHKEKNEIEYFNIDNNIKERYSKYNIYKHYISLFK